MADKGKKKAPNWGGVKGEDVGTQSRIDDSQKRSITGNIMGNLWRRLPLASGGKK